MTTPSSPSTGGTRAPITAAPLSSIGLQTLRTSLSDADTRHEIPLELALFCAAVYGLFLIILLIAAVLGCALRNEVKEPDPLLDPPRWRCLDAGVEEEKEEENKNNKNNSHDRNEPVSDADNEEEEEVEDEEDNNNNNNKTTSTSCAADPADAASAAASASSETATNNNNNKKKVVRTTTKKKTIHHQAQHQQHPHTRGVPMPAKLSLETQRAQQAKLNDKRDKMREKLVKADTDLSAGFVTGAATQAIASKFEAPLPLPAADTQIKTFYGIHYHAVLSTPLLIAAFNMIGLCAALYAITNVLYIYRFSQQQHDNLGARILGIAFSFSAVLPLTMPLQRRHDQLKDCCYATPLFIALLLTVPSFFCCGWLSMKSYDELFRPSVMIESQGKYDYETNYHNTKRRYSFPMFMFVWVHASIIFFVSAVAHAVYKQLSTSSVFFEETSVATFQYATAVASWSRWPYLTAQHWRDAHARSAAPDVLLSRASGLVRMLDPLLTIPGLEIGTDWSYKPPVRTMVLPDVVEADPMPLPKHVLTGAIFSFALGFPMHVGITIMADILFEKVESAVDDEDPLMLERFLLIFIPLISIYGALIFSAWYSRRCLRSMRRGNVDKFLGTAELAAMGAGGAANFAQSETYAAMQAGATIMALMMGLLLAVLTRLWVTSRMGGNEAPASIVYWSGYGASFLTLVVFGGVAARKVTITHPMTTSLLSPVFSVVTLITAITAGLNRVGIGLLSIATAATFPSVSLVPSVMLSSLDPLFISFYSCLAVEHQHNAPLLLNAVAVMAARQELIRIVGLYYPTAASRKSAHKNMEAAEKDKDKKEKNDGATSSSKSNPRCMLAEVGSPTLLHHPILRSLVVLHVLRMHYAANRDEVGMDATSLDMPPPPRPEEEAAQSPVKAAAQKACAALCSCCEEDDRSKNERRRDDLKEDLVNCASIDIDPLQLLCFCDGRLPEEAFAPVFANNNNNTNKDENEEESDDDENKSAKPLSEWARRRRVRRRWQLAATLIMNPELIKERKHFLYATAYTCDPTSRAVAAAAAAFAVAALAVGDTAGSNAAAAAAAASSPPKKKKNNNHHDDDDDDAEHHPTAPAKKIVHKVVKKVVVHHTHAAAAPAAPAASAPAADAEADDNTNKNENNDDAGNSATESTSAAP